MERPVGHWGGTRRNGGRLAESVLSTDLPW